MSLGPYTAQRGKQRKKFKQQEPRLLTGEKTSPSSRARLHGGFFGVLHRVIQLEFSANLPLVRLLPDGSLSSY